MLPDTFSARFARLVQKAGLPPIRLHDLRHSAATVRYASGVSIKVISEMLGHATVSFNMDTYVHAASEQKREAAGVLAAAIVR
jgi:integrase